MLECLRAISVISNHQSISKKIEQDGDVVITLVISKSEDIFKASLQVHSSLENYGSRLAYSFFFTEYTYSWL